MQREESAGNTQDIDPIGVHCLSQVPFHDQGAQGHVLIHQLAHPFLEHAGHPMFPVLLADELPHLLLVGVQPLPLV